MNGSFYSTMSHCNTTAIFSIDGLYRSVNLQVSRYSAEGGGRMD